MSLWIRGVAVFCKRHYLIVSGLFVILAFCLNFARPVFADLYSKIYPPNALVSVEAKSAIELGEDLVIRIRLDSVGRGHVPPGVLVVKFDEAFFKPKTKSAVSTSKFDGSILLVEDVSVLKSIKVHEGGSKVFVEFTSGDIKVVSNALNVIISAPKEKIVPHLDISDTSRVNLSGTWFIDVDGNQGHMILKQSTDGTLTGSYLLKGGKWEQGLITGFKDGSTFRVFFVIDKEDRKRLRVAGSFVIEKKQKGYIEIKGCAYYIVKVKHRYVDSSGEEGVHCDKPVNYGSWKGVSSSVFYATAPFSQNE